MPAIIPIEIPRRSQRCCQCSEPLLAAMTYFSLLIEDSEKDRHRCDYCELCWKKAVKTENFLQSKVYWKSRVPVKKEELGLPKDRDERALVLLKEAVERGKEEDWAEAFFLALYLARKRLIALRKELINPAGMTQQIYEILATEEMICINKIALSNIEIDKIQKRLAQKML